MKKFALILCLVLIPVTSPAVEMRSFVGSTARFVLCDLFGRQLPRELGEMTVVSSTIHISIADGEAMFFHDTEDFSDLASENDGTSNYLLEFIDSAGLKARAYASSVGGGIALGSEQIVNGTFDTDTTGWSSASDAVLSVVAQQLNVSSLAGDTYGAAAQDVSAHAGKLCNFSREHISRTGSSSSRINEGASGYTPISSNYTEASGTKAEYVTLQAPAYVQLNTNGSGTTAVYDNVTLKIVTDVPVTGLRLMSDRNGATRGMDYVEEDFNPNDIIKVKFLNP